MVLGAVSSSPLGTAVIAALLLMFSYPVIQSVARKEGDPRLARLLMLSLAFHLLGSFVQVLIVKDIYHGVADWTRYVNQGANLANNIHAGQFTLAGTNIQSRGLLGDGAVSIATGVVFSVVGVNQLGGFLVFSWLSFIGMVFFYRAFSLTFPSSNRRRYALMLFLLPSMFFWTADVSKESIMVLSLGVAAYGAARAFNHMRGGYMSIVLGMLIGVFVRPNELVLFLGSFTVAMLIRARSETTSMNGARRVLSLVFIALVLAVSASLTAKFIHSGGSYTSILHSANQSNAGVSGQGEGFGSSNIPYSSNPLTYPRDVYTVLFDPLPVTAHGATELIAALENTVIILLILASGKRFLLLPRIWVARPYVLMSTIYTAGFIYAFAALGNLGLITRERTLLLPFFLVILGIPMSREGAEPYPWEISRRERRRRSAGRTRRGAGGVEQLLEA